MPVTRVERLLTPASAGAPSQRTSAARKGPGPLARDEGEAVRLGPLTVVVKEDGSNTRQTVAVAEFGGKGFRIPPHVRTEHDQTIYVLEGTLRVRLGDRTFDAPAEILNGRARVEPSEVGQGRHERCLEGADHLHRKGDGRLHWVFAGREPQE